MRVLPTLLAGGMLVLLGACTGYGKPDAPATDLAFGVDMAKRGLWNEAMFRFEAAARADPENPRVQSNLGVAFEAQGNFDKALEQYKKALQLAPDNKQIRANYARFVEFYQAYKNPGSKKGQGILGKGKVAGSPGGTAPGGSAIPSANQAPEPPPPPSAVGTGERQAPVAPSPAPPPPPAAGAAV